MSNDFKELLQYCCTRTCVIDACAICTNMIVKKRCFVSLREIGHDVCCMKCVVKYIVYRKPNLVVSIFIAMLWRIILFRNYRCQVVIGVAAGAVRLDLVRSLYLNILNFPSSTGYLGVNIFLALPSPTPNVRLYYYYAADTARASVRPRTRFVQ